MRRSPPPLSVTRPPPSSTTRGSAAFTTFAVSRIAIVTGSGPQSKTMTPPAATAATTASDVQLCGVPIPTTRSGSDVSTLPGPVTGGTGGVRAGGGGDEEGSGDAPGAADATAVLATVALPAEVVGPSAADPTARPVAVGRTAASPLPQPAVSAAVPRIAAARNARRVRFVTGVTVDEPDPAVGSCRPGGR